MPDRRRVVIIGAGIIGAWIAHSLSSVTVASHEIIVVDCKSPGEGITAYSAGLVPPLSRGGRDHPRALYSVAAYRRLYDAVRDDSLVRIVPTAVVTAREQFARTIGVAQQFERVPTAEYVRARFTPGTAVLGTAVEVFMCHSLAVDARKASRHLVAMACLGGVNYIRSRVVGVELVESGCRLYLASGAELSADIVIQATGFDIPLAFGNTAFSGPRTERKSVRAIELTGPDATRTDECTILLDRDAFLLSHLDGSVRLSFSRDEATETNATGVGIPMGLVDALNPAVYGEVCADRSYVDSYVASGGPQLVSRRVGKSAGRIIRIVGASGAGVRLAPALAREVGVLLDV